MTAQAIKDRVQTLRDAFAKLAPTIADPKTKEILLQPASNSMDDIETLYLPAARNALPPDGAAMFIRMAEFQIGQAERQLKHVHDLIAQYGADLRAIG